MTMKPKASSTESSNQRGDAELVAMILGAICLFAVVIGIGLVLSYFKCHRQWDQAGMSDVSYGILQGCMVKMPDGRWLPADRVREFELPRPK